MEALQLKIVLCILDHAGISACLVGEIALNYYNVPRDVELCIPEPDLALAASHLASTGLFELAPIPDFDNFNEYKRGYPRIQSSHWISPPCAFVLLSDKMYFLAPLIKNIVPRQNRPVVDTFSNQIADLFSESDIAGLPVPCLPPFFSGLCQRYLDFSDDISMIAAEQLVDGMNLDNEWCDKNLAGAREEVQRLAHTLIAGKKSRIDDFSENEITCFIANGTEAEKARKIPGYESSTFVFKTSPFTIHQARLNDAAIALHRVLSGAGIKFGIFGGYSIAVLGGQRESKDIDCVAGVNKQQIIGLMDGRQGFQAVPQTRQDYVAFLWSDNPNRSHAVLVEIFCEQFPGARHTLRNVPTTEIAIGGQVLGNGRSSFFDPVFIFKGKLRAAATRAKFHDSADMRWLETRYSAQIQARRSELRLEYIGLAVTRYPELTNLFVRLGIDMNVARHAAAHLDINRLPAPVPGDVQEGLLG